MAIGNAGFQACCGINVFWGWGDSGTNYKLTEKDKQLLNSKQNGLSLVALNHNQWSEETLETLSKAGYVVLVNDFYNSNTSNKITLFGRIQHPTRQKDSKHWKELKEKYFPRKSKTNANTKNI